MSYELCECPIRVADRPTFGHRHAFGTRAERSLEDIGVKIRSVGQDRKRLSHLGRPLYKPGGS
jgi:hypothetical protein